MEASTTCPALSGDAPSSWLYTVGDREAMLDQSDLSASVELATLPDEPNLIAVGPTRSLRGEVTVYGGEIFVSTMRSGEQVVLTGDESAQAGAVFLAFGSAASWQAVQVPRPLDGLEAIEAFVMGKADEAGLPMGPEAAFPFRIEGTPERLRYHVIFREGRHETEDGGRPHGAHDGGTAHDRAAHKRAKVPFAADGEQARMAGVFVAEADVGRVTHPGRRTHLHVIVGDADGAGPRGRHPPD